VSNIKDKLKKLFVVFVSFTFLVAIPNNIKPYSYISLKGLFTALKNDDIGFAHVLLHSNWIENMYHYAEGKPPSKDTRFEPILKNDPVANLIRTLWFCRDVYNQVLPTKLGITSVLTPRVIGLCVDALYAHSEDFSIATQEWVAVYTEHIKQAQEELEELKIRQRERTALYQKVDKLIGKIKTSKKKYDKAEKAYSLQLSKQEDPRDKKDVSVLERLKKNKEKFARQQASQNLELVESQKKFSIMIDYKKKIKKLESFLRFIAKYLNVKPLDITSQGVIEAIKNKIQEIFSVIREAINFCKGSELYESRTVYAIVWAFFFHKLEDFVSQQDKIIAINECLAQINKIYKNKSILKDLYKQEDFATFENKVKGLSLNQQVKSVIDHYDLGLHYFLRLGEIFPPVIAQGNYGYEFEPGKISDPTPDCHETAILDTISVLWYNSEKQFFDDSLFPEHVSKHGEGLRRLRNALKYLYLADTKGIRADEYTCKYKGKSFISFEKLKDLGKISQGEVEKLDISQVPVWYIKRSEIKQEFMNMVSGRSDIIYCSKVEELKERGNIFELESDVGNVINILNYFYGLGATSFDQLAKELSTEKRKLFFEIQNKTKDSQGRYNTPNQIGIGIMYTKNNAHFDMTLDIKGQHTCLVIPERDGGGTHALHKDFVETILKKIAFGFQDIVNKDKCISIFTLLAFDQLLKNKEINWPTSFLNLVYYGLAIKKPEEKLKVLEDILGRYEQCYHVCEPLVHNLIDAYPLDDLWLKCKLGKIIINSGVYRKERFIKDTVEKKLLDDPEFYRYFNFRNIFLLTIEKDKKLADIIIQNPAFSISGYDAEKCFKAAFQKGYQDIMFAILNCSSFTQGGGILMYLVRNHQTDLALEVLKRDKFTYFYGWQMGEVLGIALDRLCKGIVKIIILGGFTIFEPKIKDQFRLEPDQKKYYKEIALRIVNHREFDPNCWRFNKALLEALEEGKLEDITGKIFENPKFDCWGVLLREALEERHKRVALKIVKCSEFDPSVYAVDEALQLACRIKGCEEIVEIIQSKKLLINKM